MAKRMTWDALLHSVLNLPEGRHLHVRCPGGALLLERRGEVAIALREISQDRAIADAWASPGDPQSDPHPQQLLAIGAARYLCAWRRQPTHAQWIAELAGTRP